MAGLELEEQIESYVIPLVAETLEVGKETVVTGGVRVTTHVTERVEIVDEPLRREEVQVERVPINRQVFETPQPRQEGDFWIIPILEEVVVVEKQLFLREEVRIRRTSTDVHLPQEVTLRTEEAVIEEISPDYVSGRA
ncbi:MAG: YsnF/AvaK domain-containing protein [Janthinobacterium lividum]